MTSPTHQPIRSNKTLTMILLVLAGETIFMAPFMIARVFRPTILKVFDLTNLQLGSAYSIYGIVALIAYLFGGPLADRYPAHKLMSMSLVMTALGAWFMATIPDFTGFVWLYAFYGMSTILLFWAALIKATRLWGGAQLSGRAFGLLDGGRGLFAALISTIAVVAFAKYMPTEDITLTADQLRAPLQTVIKVVAIITLLIAVILWIYYPSQDQSQYTRQRITWSDIGHVARIPTVYLQALIIVCAYVGYKSSDDFTLYAHEILGYDDAQAASIGSLSFWLRPIGAIGAGWLADRYRSTRMTMFCFALMTAGGALFVGTGSLTVGFYTALVCTSMGIYGLRGLYYAIMEEGSIPVQYTGTAVGLMAVIGYTPEIFMGPVMGYMLDHYPGILGHQLVFSLLIVFGAIGIIAARSYSKVGKRIRGKV